VRRGPDPFFYFWSLRRGWVLGLRRRFAFYFLLMLVEVRTWLDYFFVFVLDTYRLNSWHT